MNQLKILRDAQSKLEPTGVGEQSSSDKPRRRKKQNPCCPVRDGTPDQSHAQRRFPKMTKQLLFYVLLLIISQIVVVIIFMNFFKENSSIKSERKFRSSVLGYPADYAPPCHIEAKEAISALNRAVTSECRLELGEVACRNERSDLFPKTLTNQCPSNEDSFSAEEITYLGCFKDSFDNRIFQGSFSKLADNSRNRCGKTCARSGFKFMGTQYGRECFCGSAAPSSEFLVDESRCDKMCTGDKSQKCGGYLTMNVYQLGKIQREIDFSGDKSSEPVRIVFLLTVNGRAVRQLKRLIKNLFDGRSYFYIHVDARQDYMYREMKELSKKFPNFIRVTENRFSTIWGGASLLRMLTSCMSELLSMEDWQWDFVINLSESDYPVKNPQRLVEFLSRNRDKNFVKSHGRDSQIFIKKQGLDRTFHECDTHMFRLGVRKIPEGIEIDGGSDWVCLNRDFVTYVVRGDDELLRGLRDFFKYTLLPAESFFHTTIKNSRFCSSYVNNNLRLTNWKRHLGCKCQHKSIVDWCGCSPNDFLPEDWPKLNSTRSKETFFARKFEPVVSQATLDLVDAELLALRGKVEKSYWQNIFHSTDVSPKPDPAVITLGTVLAESAVEVIGLQFQSLQAVTSFHDDDAFEGIVLTFSATRPEEEEEEGLEQIFEAFVRVKVPEANLDYRDGELAVGTDFDLKELLFRNFFSAMGPHSKPVLTFDFTETSNPDGATISAKIIWKDPIGRVAHVQPIDHMNNSAFSNVAELKLKSLLLPGIWTVTFAIDESASKKHAAKIPFLVTPLLPVADELSNDDSLKDIHRVRPLEKSFTDVEEENVDVETLKILSHQAAVNSQRVGAELKDWIRDLSAHFYSVESLCVYADSGGESQLSTIPKCIESEWSTFFPDLKSTVIY